MTKEHDEITQSSIDVFISEIEGYLSKFAFQTICSGDEVRDAFLDLMLLSNKIKVEYENND